MLTLRDTRYQDVRLVFDEGPHKYNDTLGNDYKSVTTLLGSYHNKFDKDYWLKRKAKELGMSEKELRLNGMLLKMKLVLVVLKLIMDLKMELRAVQCLEKQSNI